MKRFFAGIFSVLLVLFLSQSLTVSNPVVDNDIGYSLSIENETVVTINAIQCPVISGEMNYLLVRGVSVPDKGLMNQEFMIYNNAEKFPDYNYDNLWHPDLKYPTLSGFVNEVDKYPFASDLGLRKS